MCHVLSFDRTHRYIRPKIFRGREQNIFCPIINILKNAQIMISHHFIEVPKCRLDLFNVKNCF